MGIIQDAKNSLRNIRARKLRSFLTMLGIIIGISAVIIIMAVGAGAQSLIINQIKDSGSNLVAVLPGASDENGPPASVLGIKVTTLTLDDADALRDVDHTLAVAPYVKGVATAQWRSQDVSANFTGTTADLLEVEKNEVALGRFFDAGEDREISRVAVLGSQVAEDLFDGSDPIGQEIKIKREAFRVIGVMKEKGSSFLADQDDQIFVPIKAAQKLLLGINHVNFIRAKIDDVKNLKQAQEEIKSILRDRHDITDPAQDDFSVRNTQQAMDVLTQVTDALKFFLVAIAAIALLVGGIGIMNIMLVAVNERIREIGLRKAVGAKNGDILRQFMVETVIVSIVGGVVGIIFGSSVAALVALIAQQLGYQWDLVISLESIILAVSFSALVGLIFGLYPAAKASKLDPITALRYE